MVKGEYEKATKLLNLKGQQLYEENKGKYSTVKNKVLENIIRDFELSGVHLAGKQKANFLKAKEKLSLLEAKFENNVVNTKTKKRGTKNFISNSC